MRRNKTVRKVEHDQTETRHRLSPQPSAKLPRSLFVSRNQDPESGASQHSKIRTGIVSVNGQDVGEMRCTGGRGAA